MLSSWLIHYRGDFGDSEFDWAFATNTGVAGRVVYRPVRVKCMCSRPRSIERVEVFPAIDCGHEIVLPRSGEVAWGDHNLIVRWPHGAWLLWPTNW